MKPAYPAFACLALLSSQAASAETWINVIEGGDFSLEVDADSIRRGEYGLVYFRERMYEGAEVTDRAVDCSRRVSYLIRINMSPPIDYPNWRDNPRETVPGSIGEAELDYVCARGQAA